MRTTLLVGGWLWAAAVVWLSLTPSPPDLGIEGGDKLEHVAAYAVLMAWFGWLYQSRAARLGHAALWIALGFGLEVAQATTGYREFELADIAADAMGVAVGAALAIILSRVAPAPGTGRP